jgi:hypothetical protein
MDRTFILMALLLGSASFPVHAQTSTELQAVQMPAWIERAGRRMPARAGVTLEQADIVETGAAGRMQIGLGDGSLVKLGENARLSLAELPPADTPDGTFKGLLEVIKGAFRFTTSALGHDRPRDITLRVASLTVGVRGTDLWGRSADTADTVCLIDGTINIKHAQSGDLILDQPLQFVVAPRNGAPQPLAWVETEKLKQWAAETELTPGAGVTLAAGAWVVQLSAHADVETAANEQQRLREAGYAAEVTQVQVQGKTYHRLRVAGFDTQADAKAFAGRIQGKFGARSPWVALEKTGDSR